MFTLVITYFITNVITVDYISSRQNDPKSYKTLTILPFPSTRTTQHDLNVQKHTRKKSF